MIDEPCRVKLLKVRRCTMKGKNETGFQMSGLFSTKTTSEVPY
jgi:hypothetical protein